MDDDDIPDILFIMRHVSTTKKEAGEPKLMAKYRQMFEGNFEKFEKRLADLEIKYLDSKGKKAENAPGKGEDIGQEKAEEMVRKLQQRFAESRKVDGNRKS